LEETGKMGAKIEPGLTRKDRKKRESRSWKMGNEWEKMKESTFFNAGL
jgi:hypothetical protein